MKITLSELKKMLRESLAPYLKNESVRKALMEAYGLSGDKAPTGGFDSKGKSGGFGDGGEKPGPFKVSELSAAVKEVLEEVLSVIGKDGKINVWPDPEQMTPEDKAKFEKETGKKPEEMSGDKPGVSTAPSEPAGVGAQQKKTNWGKPRDVQLQEGDYGFGYKLVDVASKTYSMVVEEHDQVGLARDLGWEGNMVSEAISFLESNVGKVFKDPGYFVTEKRSAKDERQILHIKDSLRKQHKKDGKWEKGWDENRVVSVAFATFNSEKKKSKAKAKGKK